MKRLLLPVIAFALTACTAQTVTLTPRPASPSATPSPRPSSPGATPSPTPTASPRVAAHLYVGDDNSSGSLRAYALPLTASSTPVASIPVNVSLYVASNASYVAVTSSSNVIMFPLPLSSSTSPIATFSSGCCGAAPVFFPNGTLAIADDGSGNPPFDLYSPPFTNATTQSGTFAPAGLSNAHYSAFDPAGNLYVNDSNRTITAVTGSTETATVTGPSGIQYRGMAATATQLFACGFNANDTNLIDVYALPLTSSSTPAFEITNGAQDEACAVDASGNLYSAGASGPDIEVYTPPFSSSSAPSVSVPTNATVFGMSIGP
jgi:hypothetical protein